MDEDFPISEAIKVGREWSGASIRELARRTGVSAAQISRIEAGEVTRPSIETLLALARELDANPVTLMVLAGHLQGEEARAALRPLVAGDSGIEEHYGDWHVVAAFRHIVDDPETTENELRRVAFSLFSTPDAVETTWQESFRHLASQHLSAAGADLGEVVTAWPLIDGERRRRILEFVRDQQALSNRARRVREREDS